jgi:hypothetical protein
MAEKTLVEVSPAEIGRRRFLTPDLCTFQRFDSCVNSAPHRNLAGMGRQVIDNTGKPVHRILCTGLQEAIAMGIVSGSRIFIGSPKDFYKAAMGAGFVLAAHF